MEPGSFSGGPDLKNPPAVQETGVPSLGGEEPLEESMGPRSSVLPGEPHGQRGLGPQSMDHKESIRLSH